jgi:hypothetical protein
MPLVDLFVPAALLRPSIMLVVGSETSTELFTLPG